MFVKSSIVKHANALVVAKLLKVRVHVTGFGQVVSGFWVAIAELDAVLVLVYLKHSDFADDLAARPFFLRFFLSCRATLGLLRRP